MRTPCWAVGTAVLAVACHLHLGGDDASGAATSDAPITADSAPDDLAATGLYADLASKAPSPRARPFAPAKAFWSDGADKARWIDLPDGQPIDASAMDDWTFPVGTKVWKEISVHGHRVETRFWWKVRADRWLAATYQWAPDETSASRVTEGADVTVDGVAWHIPTASECNDCHDGRKDKLLGFEAISLGLPGATGLTLDALAAEARLQPPPAKTSVAIADDGTGHAAEALTWLHANCGTTCHNANTTAKAYSTRMHLRLAFADLDRAPDASWDVIANTVDKAAFSPTWAGALRIVPGDPESSLIVKLASERGQEQMPPIATTVVDAEGVASVSAWITAMKAHRKKLDPREPSAEPPPRPSASTL